MDKNEYKELCAMAANGDTKSFAKLYETVYREMYYTAYYSLADDVDAVGAVTESVRSAFKSIGKLHTESAFVGFIMKNLCACIKIKFKDYAANGRENRYDGAVKVDGVDIKREFNNLPDTERLVAALYVGGKFQPDEISHFTGLSTATVRKKLDKALSSFALD